MPVITWIRTKDPDEVLDYKADWSADMTEMNDDTILASSWFIPDGLTDDSDSHDETSTTIWLSGGAVGETYSLVNRITTTGGRILEQTFRLKLRTR